MDKRQAQKLVSNTLQNDFDKDRFIYFVKNLLNHIEGAPFVYKGNFIFDDFADSINTVERIGKYKDPEGKLVDILIVRLKKQASLDRARTKQRNFVAKYLRGSRGGTLKDAALVAFVSPDEDDWRFSLVEMEYKFNEKGKVEEEFTPARRHSFLVGVNESSHTAQSQLVPLLEDDLNDPTLKRLEESFNIEKVTKEFFEKYHGFFLKLKESLDEVVKREEKVKADFKTKNIHTVDFAKKLLGQIVFLYFLQKKGWFGVKRDEDWGTGPKNFLRELFDGKHGKYANFFNDIMEPLFYQALRNDRRHDDDYYDKLKCKVPFLNGGLFDPINNYDWVHTDILLSNELFSNSEKTKEGDTGNGILDIFDRYNFTVKEDEPLEKEVAVDPEMLGKVFENLLEVKDRKSKGTYYTPREIVHYMCQQSLINYLHSELNPEAIAYEKLGEKQFNMFGNKAQKGQLDLTVEHRSSPEIPKEDIEILIQYGESVAENEATVGTTKKYSYKLKESIRQNAKLIDDKLASIKICDPAIGSGAFPVGMMSEIVKTRNVLSAYIKEKNRSIYNFKRECIEKSLYGVDIDPGAVEIAKLRLWLSLVVDEDDIKQIKPLPNLDYKIVCGNSLLSVSKNLFNNKQFIALERLKPLLFNETNPEKKREYKEQIDQLISQITNGHKDFDFEVYFSEVFHEKKGFDVVIANPPYIDSETMVKEQPVLRQKYSELYSAAKGNWDLFVVFIEKGFCLLKLGGAISYIVPNKLIGASYTKELRGLLLSKNIREFRDYSRVDVFKEVSVYPMVFVAINNSTKESVLFTGMKSEIDVAIQHKIDPELFYQDIHWDKYYLSQDKLDIILKFNTIKKLSLSMKKISDAASVSEAYEIKKYLKESSSVHTNKYKKFINTGTIDPFISLWGKKKTQYIKSSYFKPIILDTDLRALSQKRFKQACSNKIIISGMSKRIECFYDEGGYLAGKSTIIILEDEDSMFHLKYLLAVMNSTLLSFWYINYFSSLKMAGEFLNISTKELGFLPIKELSKGEQKPFIETVDKILAITKSADYLQNEAKQKKVKEYERQIDEMVYKLYGLTKEEIKIIG